MKIALAQMDIVWEDKEKNRKKVEGMIRQAKEEKTDLLLLPEMSLTGFSMNVKKIGEVRQKDGMCESEYRMKELAKKYEIAVGFGYVEKEKSKGKNHYIVLGKDGTLKSDYIKIHPFSYGKENKYYEPGSQIKIFSINEMRFGTFICYDLRFPELFTLSSERAETLIVAANWPRSRREHWTALLKARAIENQCYVLGVNRTGSGGGHCYAGDSMVIDPYGTILGTLSEKEGIIFCEIDRKVVEKWRREFPQKKDRKKNYKIFLDEKG